MRQWLGGCVWLLLGTACSDFVGAAGDTSSSGPSAEGSSSAPETSGSTSSTPGTTTVDTLDTTSGTTTEATTTGPFTTDTSSSSDPTSGDSSSSGEPPEGCDNDLRDGDETDIDCGGTCKPCDFGLGCAAGSDCHTGFCSAESTCGLQPPLVWLDASAPSTLFSDDGCTTSPPTNGQQVYCWANQGTAGGMFVDAGAQPAYQENEDGLEFGDDLLSSQDPIFGGNVDDVTVFVVQRELSSRNSYDFNLNHPFEMNMSRYSTHIPWGSSRRVVFDIGGTGSERIETDPDVIEVGQTHIFAFVNSATESARMIRIDGTERASGDGNLSGAAGTISIGSGAHIRVHEFRVYTPSPSETHRQLIEGQLACKWSMRDQLPPEHPFHADDGDDQTGCPPALD